MKKLILLLCIAFMFSSCATQMITKSPAEVNMMTTKQLERLFTLNIFKTTGWKPRLKRIADSTGAPDCRQRDNKNRQQAR
ncbi:hypothetical protein ACL9RF_03195 [Sphingobacterium sp. Mn56C]|uniref:hypothetical protein n=1 Tax=Sphingobacterium sp. Mn56C TaxID=3395261 RepID=UPI003BC407DB